MFVSTINTYNDILTTKSNYSISSASTFQKCTHFSKTTLKIVALSIKLFFVTIMETLSAPFKKIHQKLSPTPHLPSPHHPTPHLPPPIADFAAGVLPFHIDSQRQTWFLLGLESHNGTWCDFGGSIDQGETSRQAAVRECWEESRCVLGEKSTIDSLLHDPIGIGYRMYFMELKSLNGFDPTTALSEQFDRKHFADPHFMEKKKISWIRAKDVINAVENKTNQVIINGIDDRLRGVFAKTISDNIHFMKSKFNS